jgi:hypothetical protein
MMFSPSPPTPQKWFFTNIFICVVSGAYEEQIDAGGFIPTYGRTNGN